MSGGGSSSKGRNGSSSLGKPGGKGSATNGFVPDHTVNLPHLKTAENAKLLPKYFAALQRSRDDTLPPEDLDAIQAELETLLSTVALRYRFVRAEYDQLADDRKDKKGKYMDKPPASPGKRKRFDEKSKKDSKSGSQAKISKLKHNPVQSPAPSQHTDDSMDALLPNQKDNPKLMMSRNDTPNRFWLSVEPYCMPLTHEDIKLLDDLLEEYAGPLIPPIPELGPHYSSVWANEDLKEEQDNSNPKAKSKSNTSYHSLIKKSEKLMGENVTGPLTQRLVSALMEENLMPDSMDSNSGSENTSSDLTSNRSSLPPMKNGIYIERRVRKELIEQGILDPEDLIKEEDDEILSEIKRVRTELSAIAEYNSSELKKLYGVAQEEMKRLEVKRKLDSVDQEIIETYKRVSAAKQKKRPLTKQERDEVFRLSEEQKRLSDLLESMPVPGLDNCTAT